jgi:glycosyltransferase involved in cell wall biosynthesis
MSRVSVITPAHNAEKYLRTSIESVIAQSQRDWELIIIDDGSTDKTRALAMHYARTDKRISVLALDTIGGVSRARNHGIAAARGEWITLLDADDWYHPRRLDTLIKLAELKQATVIIDNQFHVYRKAPCYWLTLFEGHDDEIIWLTLDDMFQENRLGRMFNIGQAKPLIKASLFETKEGNYIENLRIGEDYLLLLNLCLRAGRVLAYRCPLYYYRCRRDSLSRIAKTIDFISFRNEVSALVAQVDIDSVSQDKIDAMRADLDSHIQIKNSIDQIRLLQIKQFLLLIMRDASLRRALAYRMYLKIYRQAILSWPGIPPSFILQPHKLRLGHKTSADGK